MCILYTNLEFGSKNHFTDHKINLFIFFSKYDIIFKILKLNFDINIIFPKVCYLLRELIFLSKLKSIFKGWLIMKNWLNLIDLKSNHKTIPVFPTQNSLS